MNKMHLLDATMGIQSVLDMPETQRLPDAMPLASTALHPVGMEALYGLENLRTLVESALQPAVGDGDILRPEAFSANIRQCAESLRHADDPVLRAVVAEELDPLLANDALLRAYTGLMIGG